MADRVQSLHLTRPNYEGLHALLSKLPPAGERSAIQAFQNNNDNCLTLCPRCIKCIYYRTFLVPHVTCFHLMLKCVLLQLVGGGITSTRSLDTTCWLRWWGQSRLWRGGRGGQCLVLRGTRVLPRCQWAPGGGRDLPPSRWDEDPAWRGEDPPPPRGGSFY